MKKSLILMIVIILVLAGLGVGAFFFFQDSGTQVSTPVPVEVIGYDFPASADEIDWENREIFKAGLVDSAQGILDKLPGASSYFIEIEIPQDLVSTIKGHQVVRYFNTEDQALNEVYFRLFPNYQGGLLTVSHLTVNGGAMIPSLESSDTALRVDLNHPLQPGDSLIMEMDFELEVPTEMGGNYGLFGYFEDVLVLDQLYPIIPAFDDHGWYKADPMKNGDLTYQDSSFYVVRVKAPKDLVMVASGVVVDYQENADTQTTVFAIGPARDFYLAGSKKFTMLEETVDDLTVKVYTLPGFEVNQGYAVEFALEGIDILSENVGDYPYTEFEVLSSPMQALGMEYPGLTSILVNEFDDGADLYGMSSLEMLEGTLVHEIAHQWFFNIVGNDAQREPWVDESLVQYMTYFYFLDRYGRQGGNNHLESFRSRWSRVENADIPVGMPAEEYHGAEYSGIVYGRGPLFFYQLEKDLGLDTVMAAVKQYYESHQWGNAYAEDIQAAFEKTCSCDLSAQFNQWVYTEQ